MRILLNAVPLAVAGGRTVGLNLLRALPRVGAQHDFLALTPRNVGYEEVCRSAGLEYRTYGRGVLYPAWRLGFDQVGVQRRAMAWRADVVFSLGNFGPIWPVIPQATLFMHPHFVYPNGPARHLLGQPEAFVLGLQRLIFGLSIRRAAAVLPQTPVAAERLVSIYGVPTDRLRVIPPAVTMDGVEERGTSNTIERTMGVRSRGRIRLLTLSRYYPHKNFEWVVKIAATLKERGDDRFVFFITIAAEQHPRAEALLGTIKREELTDSVINLGPIPMGDLAALYHHSDALFYPTLLESFSSTYLEAMHHGLPILTTDIDFARYCCGSAALYFDPASTDSTLTVLDRFATDRNIARGLIDRGRQQLEGFERDWDLVALRYLEVLEAAARGEPLPIAGTCQNKNETHMG